MRTPFVILPQSSECSSDKAWLMGLVAGDGHLQWKEGHYYKLFINCGGDIRLAERAAAVIRAIYGVPCQVLTQNPKAPRRPYYYPHCARKAVLEDLFSLAPFGVQRWRVPQVVIDGVEEVRAAWIRGFADAEGCMIFVPERSQRYVSLDSTNAEGLAQVASLLDSLEIRYAKSSRVSKKAGESPSHKLMVCYHEDLKRYAKLVGFTCDEKKAKLEAAIASYERTPKRTEEIEEHLPEIRRRREAGATWNEIAVELGLSRENVRELCYRHEIESKVPVRGRIDRLAPEIRTMVDQGLEHAEVAQRLGITRQSLRNAIARAKRKEHAGSAATDPGD